MDGRDLLRDVKAVGMVNRVVIRGGRAMEMERKRIRVERERAAFLLSSGLSFKIQTVICRS
jgi:hypothetical protein